jgi:hypothetical protein
MGGFDLAKVTFTVTNIGGSGGPNNSVIVSFSMDVEGDAGGGKRHLGDPQLYFPREVGREFEVDDTYPLDIQPKPEGKH